jgi:hypothetical protein
MTPVSFRSSRPDSWTVPRPFTDASQRYMSHGPIQPMQQERAFWRRLFGL